jgi:hypothetical protein
MTPVCNILISVSHMPLRSHLLRQPQRPHADLLYNGRRVTSLFLKAYLLIMYGQPFSGLVPDGPPSGNREDL